MDGNVLLCGHSVRLVYLGAGIQWTWPDSKEIEPHLQLIRVSGKVLGFIAAQVDKLMSFPCDT